DRVAGAGLDALTERVRAAGAPGAALRGLGPAGAHRRLRGLGGRGGGRRRLRGGQRAGGGLSGVGGVEPAGQRLVAVAHDLPAGVGVDDGPHAALAAGADLEAGLLGHRLCPFSLSVDQSTDRETYHVKRGWWLTW